MYIPPGAFKMKDDSMTPFYTHPGGYRICLSVNARGDGIGRGTHSIPSFLRVCDAGAAQ